jgi:glyoxylase-like metal-dependent hydrolase (beta-lactamase superfamily II)
LAQTKEQLPGFEDVRVVLPDLTFEQGHLDIHLGGTSVRLLHMPGHSLDLIAVWLMGEGILFASDNMMPVPTLFDGDFDSLKQSLKQMLNMDLECVVQGHGEVILRGEINMVLESNLAYLDAIRRRVGEAIDNGVDEESLDEITIESCGKSRIPLNGLVSDLHHANLMHLYQNLRNGG